MSNVVFAYPDYLLTATLTPNVGSWTNLDYLKDPLRDKLAVAAQAPIVSFRCNFGVSRPLQVFTLPNHNLSINASTGVSSTIKISLFDSAAYAAPIGGTGWNGATTAAVPIYSGSPAINAEDLATYRNKPDWWYVLAAEVSAQYMQVDFSDSSNAEGVRLGRMFCSKKYSPAVNFDYGAGFTWKEIISKETSVGAVDWIDSLALKREFRGRFGTLQNSESQVLVSDRQRRLGLSGELYFIEDPDAATGILKTHAFLARFADENPLVRAAYGNDTHEFTLEEI